MPNRQAGFSVVEVIIAIVILSLAVLSGFQLVGSFITTVSNNKDRLTATYLAQECLENARNNRDTNWKNFQAWHENLISEETESFKKFTIQSDSVIKHKTIKIEKDDVKIPNSVKITCTVTWNNEGQSVKMESVLTNWQNN